MILRVFDTNSLIHTPWIVPIVPWGPLSLLVVPLTSVNSFHYWLVIRRCSCMFDFSSRIRMLGLVLFSGRIDSRPRTQLTYVWAAWIGFIIITWLVNGWLRPYLSLPGWLRPYLHYHYGLISWVAASITQTHFICLWMAAPMPRLRVICYQRCQLYLRAGSSWWCSSSVSFVKHFTPPTLSGFIL